MDGTHPYTVSFDAGADPAAVAAAFLREAAVGGDVAGAWRVAIEARVRHEVAAVHAAADDLARRLSGSGGADGGVNAPPPSPPAAAAVSGGGTNPTAQSGVPPTAARQPQQPTSYTLQFTPDAHPVAVAWEFLARTGQLQQAAAGAPGGTGRPASGETARWASEIAAALAEEQARMRAAAVSAATQSSGGGGDSGGDRQQAQSQAPSSAEPPVDPRPTVDVGGGGGGDDGSSASGATATPTATSAAAGSLAGAGTGTPGTGSRGRALLQTAPFDGLVPIAVEGAPPTGGESATAADASRVLPFDIPVAAGESLPEAAHGFCARHWSALEPALRAMVNATTGAPAEALTFSGPNPYADVLDALPPGSPEAAYWSAPGRQVLLHYCAREVHALMARYFVQRQARRGSTASTSDDERRTRGVGVGAAVGGDGGGQA